MNPKNTPVTAIQRLKLKLNAATAAGRPKVAPAGGKTERKGPLLEKSARVQLDGQPPVFDVFTADCMGRKKWIIALASSKAKDEKTLFKVLNDVGALLPENVAVAKKLVTRLVEATPLSTGGSIITRWGWTEPGKVFVANNRFIQKKTVMGKPGAASILRKGARSYACAHFDKAKEWNILGPTAIGPETDGAFLRAGSLVGWKGTVGKICTYSSLLKLSVALALTPPLLALLEEERFLVMMTGPTSLGKTSAETAAGSVIGRPTADHLPNWKLSDARLEQLGRFHNDNLLIIDDLKTAEGSDKERFQALQQRAHWFSSGGKRGRHAKAMENFAGRADSHLSLRAIILSSYEHPIDEIAKRAKSVFDGGDVVRIVDVAASPAGAVMIFDHPLPKREGKDRQEVAEGLLADLRAGAQKHHRVVFDTWMKILIDDPDGAKAAIKSSMEDFIKAADLATASSAVRRHVRHLALTFGVGAYAIKCKILPWSVKKFKVDMLKIYATARARLEKTLTPLPEALDRLEKHLGDKSRVVPWPTTGLPKASAALDGWFKVSGADTEYFIKGTKFRAWFQSPAERELVESDLQVRGWFKKTKSTTTDVRLAGGKKIRCYHLVIPQKP